MPRYRGKQCKCGEPFYGAPRCRNCTPYDYSKLADRVDWAITYSGLMLKQIAHDSGVSMGFISQLRHGGEHNPTLRTLTALALAIHTSPAWLAFGVGPVWTQGATE